MRSGYSEKRRTPNSPEREDTKGEFPLRAARGSPLTPLRGKRPNNLGIRVTDISDISLSPGARHRRTAPVWSASRPATLNCEVQGVVM